MIRIQNFLSSLFISVLVFTFNIAHAQDSLPSWNERPAKQAIQQFVQKTTTINSKDFVPPAERIATFDQDGTLWVEHPMYPQVIYCLDRASELVKTKPEGIHLMIGRRPYAAFGNSAGDQQMLEYTKAGEGTRLAMLVLHDDAKREYAYGPALGLPNTKVGTFSQALYDKAKKEGWIVISMKNDWKQIFAFDTK